MAATTLTNLLDMAGTRRMALTLQHIFTAPDKLAAVMPMVRAPGGARFTQKYADAAGAATHMTIYDSMTASARTHGEYEDFLRVLYKMDENPEAFATEGPGAEGEDHRQQKKLKILEGVSTTFRQSVQVGTEHTGAIGTDLAALGVTEVIVGGAGSQFEYSHVHNATSVEAQTHKFKWTNADDGFQYMAPGDSEYGPKVTLSATHRYRVPLYSGGTTGSRNQAKWCFVTATWATINAAGDFVSDAADKYYTATPSKGSMGLYYKVAPENVGFDNISFNSDGMPTNPTAAGANASEGSLTWLTQKLLDGANGDASRCVLVCDDFLHISMNAIINALGMKAPVYRFMGRELHDLNFGGIHVHRSPFMPTDLVSPNAGTTNCRSILGLVLGEDACHVRYSTLANSPVFSQLVAQMSGSSNISDPAGTRNLPVAYYETLSAPNKLVSNQIAVMLYQAAIGGFNKSALLTNLTK